jgi:dipeptidyl aminopeptidase/acylaminoacyl peptidase
MYSSMEMAMDWRDRFRAQQVWDAQLAPARPDRGIVVTSADGTSIQQFAWDVPTGELRALTTAPHGVVDGWLDPIGSYLYYLADEDGSELGHLVRVPFDLPEPGGEPLDLTPNLPPYTLRGVGFNAAGTLLTLNPINDDGFALYAVDLGPEIGEPRLLHRDKWEVWGALASARGDLAACWSTAKAGGVRLYTLLVFDSASGELVGELDDGREAKVVGVRFSPIDGDSRVLANTTRSGYTRPVIWDPRSGERRDLTLDELRGDVVATDWSPDGQHVLVCQLAGEQRLFVYDLAAGDLRPLDHPPGTYYNPIDGGAAYCVGGHVVGIRNTAEAPAEVVELDGHSGRRLRTLLPSASAPPGRPWRSVTFESSDGTPVQAWLAVPEGDGPFPTILETHGGPHYTADEHYDPSAQFWLDHGYAWISVNFRGSLGFGRAFAEQIWGDLGNLELEDMVAARDYLVERGISRPDQIFLSGGSYGGYLTLLGLGKRPDLWAGGMAIAADADMTMSYEDSSAALKAAVAGWMRGTPSERPEAYVKSSPITYAADVAAPVLVFNMRNDTNVPPRQMVRYERRMRELGKDIEVVWLDGGHQSSGPEMWVNCHERMLAFTQRVLGQ